MALTTEQQAQVDLQAAINDLTTAQQTVLENLRQENVLASQAAIHSAQVELQAKQTKLEAIRLAQQTLVENARSKPVDTRDISASDITTFASELVAYINA